MRPITRGFFRMSAGLAQGCEEFMPGGKVRHSQDIFLTQTLLIKRDSFILQTNLPYLPLFCPFVSSYLALSYCPGDVYWSRLWVVF